MENDSVGDYGTPRVDPDHRRRDLGLVYLRWRTPERRDFYGGPWPGNNLFAESLVCVDETGSASGTSRSSTIRSGISQLLCADLLVINVNGRRFKAVASPSKAVVPLRLRPVTGQPVWQSKSGQGRPVRCARREKLRRRSHSTDRLIYARNYLKGTAI